MLTHREFTDEELCAYLDGALDAPTRAAIDAALGESSALRLRLESLERVSAAVRDAGGDLEPAPDRFERLVNDAFDKRESAKVVPLRARFSDAGAIKWRAPIAAGLALFVTGGAGYWMGSNAPNARADFALLGEGGALFDAIETTPSGQSVAVARQTLTPVLSFVAADGRMCREIEVTSSEAQSVGILCRSDDAWRVELMMTSAAVDASGYETVGDDAAQALELAYARLGGGAALDADAEAALISGGWRD